MRVLGLIPARGGSKGIPRKNIRLLAGKPLLQYTADAALAAKRLDSVILSTEDEEIAQVGLSCGLNVPFLRPPELAQDDTPTLPVVQHALRFMDSHAGKFDAVCLLQTTSPLRSAEEIDGCIALLEKTDADAAVSVLPVPHVYNPHWVFFRSSDGRMTVSTGEETPIPRRQSLPPAFHRDGKVYVTRSKVLLQENSLYGRYLQGFETRAEARINLDTEADWTAAEAYFQAKRVARCAG